MKNITAILVSLNVILLLVSCVEPVTETKKEMPSIPVRTTALERGSIENYSIFNGKTIYLKKNKIVTPISGYISLVNVHFGDKVNKGDVLFEMETKENIALENHQNNIKVKANSDGTIMELFVYQPGNYITENEVLCSIVDTKSFLIEVSVPYEYNNLLKVGSTCKVLLPDNTEISAKIATILPTINESNQTQNVILKTDLNTQLPENLNVTVQFIINKHNAAFIIPRDGLMTNEKQNDFWIMKLVDDSMAIKISVKKGIENDSMVEIISDNINVDDLIISKGAYGLPDSSIVNILN